MCSWSFIYSNLRASKNKSLILSHWFWLYKNLVKNLFSFEYKKRKAKYTINSIVLQILLCLIIVICFMNFMNFDFNFKFFIFNLRKYTQQSWSSLLIFLFYFMIFAFKVFFLPSLKWIFIQRMWFAQLAQFAGKCFFFQSPFEANKMFSLPNRFVLFTNHNQPLKCVRQNTYLDLWSNTLYFIWQGVYLLVRL